MLAVVLAQESGEDWVPAALAVLEVSEAGPSSLGLLEVVETLV